MRPDAEDRAECRWVGRRHARILSRSKRNSGEPFPQAPLVAEPAQSAQLRTVIHWLSPDAFRSSRLKRKPTTAVGGLAPHDLESASQLYYGRMTNGRSGPFPF